MLSVTVLYLLFAELLYGLVAFIRMNPGEEGCPCPLCFHYLKRLWFNVAFPGTGYKLNKALCFNGAWLLEHTLNI